MRPASCTGTWASLALAFTLLSPIAHTSAQSMAALSVSEPSGGCRLTLLEGGRAFLNYGAAPWRVSVTPHTFRFNELVVQLHEISYAHRDRATRGEVVGTVSLPGSSELRFIDDARMVRPLLERAWSARLAPTPPFENEEHHERIAGACGFSNPTSGASRSSITQSPSVNRH